MLQEKIKKDLITARKKKNKKLISNLTVILGEFQRGDKKQLSDKECIKIIKKIYKFEKERLSRIDLDNSKRDTSFIKLLDSYLPQMASEEEIRNWISENIDFSKFKNKMQAMKPIMSHFGQNVDGNLVRKILEEEND